MVGELNEKPVAIGMNPVAVGAGSLVPTAVGAGSSQGSIRSQTCQACYPVAVGAGSSGEQAETQQEV